MTERRSKLLVVIAVWLSFLVVSLVSAPIPAVNEPHYLAMARHYWDSSWCAGDLFLQSVPAHRVFYQTFGWLTLWLDLATVALLGRVVSLALLAASWTSLVIRLQREGSVNPSVVISACERPRSGERGYPADSDHRPVAINALLAAWLFLGLQAIGNLSGEWLIRGFESKVIAYAFVFWGIGLMLDRKLIASAMCSGVAISFHPIVGLWHVTALVIAEVANFKFQISNRRWLIAAALLAVTALPGLWPAVEMLRDVNPRAAFAANYIQVFYRLKHHLDPMNFGAANYVGYGLLTALWLAMLVWLRRRQTMSQTDRWWIGFVAATALFALGGLLAGFGPRPAEFMPGFRWRMVLLKFYPFRLFDLMLPIAVAMLLPRVFQQRSLWLVGLAGLGWALISDRVVPPPNRLPTAMQADWRAACRWVAANTPPDAVFHTPDEAVAFKWFAQRAEYVNPKDCPQDAAGIVEWNDRLRRITKWSARSFDDDQTYSLDELRELVRQTGVRFAIIGSRERYEVPDADLLYSNDSYKILRLPEAERRAADEKVPMSRTR
ncbi:MAG: DUF6798 domain-containing protein [Planctomycetaceae bacterium]